MGNSNLDLEAIIKYYLQDVLRMGHADIVDSAVPKVIPDENGKPLLLAGRYQLALPLKAPTLAQYMGITPADVAELSRGQIFSLMVGILYQLVGHLISGEPYTKSEGYRIVYNLMNEVNEHTVTPETWPGATPYLALLWEIYARSSEDNATMDEARANFIKEIESEQSEQGGEQNETEEKTENKSDPFAKGGYLDTMLSGISKKNVYGSDVEDEENDEAWETALMEKPETSEDEAEVEDGIDGEESEEGKEMSPEGVVSLSFLDQLLKAIRSYRTLLWVPYNGMEAIDFPSDHELEEIWPKVKGGIRSIRAVHNLFAAFRIGGSGNKRAIVIPKVIKDMNDWWIKNGHEQTTGLTLEEALLMLAPRCETPGGVATGSCSGKGCPVDGEAMENSFAQAGGSTDIEKGFENIQKDYEQALQEQSDSPEAVASQMEKADKDSGFEEQNAKGHGSEKGEVFNSNKVWPVKYDVVNSLRNAIKMITYSRRMAGRGPSIVGSSLYPPNFYQVKTNPEDPMVRKDRTRMKDAPVTTHIQLMFDRSGSMSGKPEDVCRDIAATFAAALSTERYIKLDIAGFDTEVYRVNMTKGEEEARRQITGALRASGGTEFPVAMRIGIENLRESPAPKKILIMLTDGDIHGSYDVRTLNLFGKHNNINTIIITLEYEITNNEYCDELISVGSAGQLPKQISNAALSRI